MTTTDPSRTSGACRAHRRAATDDGEFPGELVLGKSAAIRRIAAHVRRVSEFPCTVLVTGETGTGKEVWARLVHSYGVRSGGPFIPVNCAALTPTLAESQLFGHEKGSFTGASGSSLGVFRSAEKGVVFLDEIGEMPLELQPKLLRVLQEHEVTPVGASHPVQVDVQVVAATNRDLEEEVAAGRFREDLYYRLSIVEFVIPPLRDRVEDIPEFVNFFSDLYARQYRSDVWEPDAETLAQFCEYTWPGNIRELAHVIEQSYVLACAPVVPNRAGKRRKSGALPHLNLNRLRNEAVRQALNATGGHMGRAARLLGVHANTMTRLVKGAKDEESADASA
mgnify:CR=1 FL=1